MANEEHMTILKQGALAWNVWRHLNQVMEPDLSEADLREIDLPEVNLFGADLTQALLFGANLRGANLVATRLIGTRLSGAGWTETRAVDGKMAFIPHFINGPDLSGANLNHAFLQGTDLTGANLTGATLHGVILNKTTLRQTNLTDITMASTFLNNLDLREVQGLETVYHFGPSNIDIQTIYQSHGEIPEIFLRGVGVPDQFIEYMHSLVAAKAINYHSCFISYSSKDQAFAERLYADLLSKGVLCWYALEDLPIGEKIRPGIDQAIRKHEKVLLVLSEHSVASDWVEQEAETTFERERKEKKLVLFPVRLDEAVMQINDGWPAHLRRTRKIGNFTGWETYNAYQKAFGRLLRDLKAASS